MEIWGKDLVTGSEKPADIWASESPVRLERKRKRPTPVALHLVEAFHAATDAVCPGEQSLVAAGDVGTQTKHCMQLQHLLSIWHAISSQNICKASR